jgi:hypothetical protein
VVWRKLPVGLPTASRPRHHDSLIVPEEERRVENAYNRMLASRRTMGKCIDFTSQSVTRARSLLASTMKDPAVEEFDVIRRIDQDLPPMAPFQLVSEDPVGQKKRVLKFRRIAA